MNINKILITFCLIYAIHPLLYSQNSAPVIRNYTATEYQAADQNWAIIQDRRGFLYFANSAGILEFDGVNWRLIKVGDNFAVNSLFQDNTGKIYIGSVGEVGYLKADAAGSLKYISLAEQIPRKFRDFKNVRDIWNVNGMIIFRSAEEILIFVNDKFKKAIPSNSKDGFNTSFAVNNNFFVLINKKGLFNLQKDTSLSFIRGSEIFSENPTRAIISYKNNKLLFVSLNSGIYEYNGNLFKKIKTPIDNLIENRVYKVLNYKDKYFIFGLLAGGILLTDENFNPIQNITSQNGTELGSIYSIFADKYNKIWFGLSAGICLAELNSPVSVYDETYGLNSQTTCSVIFNNKLFIGNATGIFYKNWNDKDNKESFSPLVQDKNIQQIKKMGLFKNEIIGCSQNGFFEVSENKYNFIIRKSRIKTFIKLQKFPDYIITAGNDGLKLVKFEKNIRKVTNLRGFNENCKTAEQDKFGNIWVADRNNLIYKIEMTSVLSEKTDSLENIEKFAGKNLRGLPSETGNYILKINGNIVISTPKGLYEFDYPKDSFFEMKEINQIIGDKCQITDLIQDSNQNLWMKTQTSASAEQSELEKFTVNLILLKKQSDSYLKIEEPFYRFINDIYSINQITDSTVLIGNSQGFNTINLNSEFEKEDILARFSKVALLKSDSSVFKGTFIDDSGKVCLNQNPEQKVIIRYDENSIGFSFSALNFSINQDIEYLYKLEGFDTKWSKPQKFGFKEYTNLREGKYTMLLKVKNYNSESKIASYTFVILPPWYRTFWAYICYFIVFILIVYVSVKLNSLRLIKQQKLLELLVKQRTAEIEQQKEEILTQNETLLQQKEEILTQNEILSQSKEEIQAQNEQILMQHDELYKQKRDIVDSINYAAKIQNAILPSDEIFAEYLPEHFVLFKPRNIVSGDFYWMKKIKNFIIIAVADCTGHGVPGAFMSMLGMSFLNEIVSRASIDSTGLILNNLRKRIKQTLKQYDPTVNQKDGMDIVLISIDIESLELQYSGANNPLYIIRNSNEEIHFPENGKIETSKSENAVLFEFKADRQPVAVHIIEKEFTTLKFQLQKADVLYAGSDGYVDQFGGEKQKKFLSRNFKKLLLEIHNKPLFDQKEILDKTIIGWKNKFEQVDDILVIGLKI